MQTLLRVTVWSFLLVSLAGCSWFQTRERGDYKDAKSAQPLEIPEGLDAPRDAAALTIPDTTSGTNATVVSDTPPSVTLNAEPIVPISTPLAPAEAYARVETALRGTSGFTLSDANAESRTFKVTTEVAQARRTWWSRLSGRDRTRQSVETRTVGVLGVSGGGSAVAVQDAKGNDDAAARRILTAIRQSLR